MRRSRVESRESRVLRALVFGLVLCTAGAPIARAQEVVAERHPSSFVRSGKWVALGLAAGTTLLGIRAHEHADGAFDRLRDYCSTIGSCALGADGRYTNAGAEAIYREVRSGDRAARSWLAAGQTLLVGSVALFVLDLRNRGRPENEPLGRVVVWEAGALGTTRIGLRFGL